MRKPVILLTVLLGGTLASLAQDQDFSKVQIKVSKVAGGVYLLQGEGGNIAASIGEDGIILVDDQYAPLAEKIQAALRGITDKPIRFVINTHYHVDHTNGNEYFQKETPVVAHDNVRKRMEQGGTAGNMGSILVTATLTDEPTRHIRLATCISSFRTAARTSPTLRVGSSLFRTPSTSGRPA